MSSQERSLDQQAMDLRIEAWPLLRDRIIAFAEGRLRIWSDPVEMQDSAGCIHTLQPGQWIEVRDASAIFVREAKYKIVWPSWREPTDEDAKEHPRQMCRARDSQGDCWHEQCQLLYVHPHLPNKFLVIRKGGAACYFRYCEVLEMEESTDA